MTTSGRNTGPTYDRIGVGYVDVRQPDPRLAAIINDALGDAETVVNVGAGAGSYEPGSRRVVALEPARVMLAQHPGTRRVQGVAEALPFPDASFDAAMAILTVHHWRDLHRGLAEMKRVARRQVIFTWDPHHDQELWIVSDYVPSIGVMERARFTPLAEVIEALDAHTVQHFEIPHDFTDGFQAAFWRRPEAYLDPQIRAASSTFAELPPSVVEPGIDQLRRDLASGAWVRTHADLLAANSVDYGHRVVVAG
jgi:SAM-dependent methyltransferase